MYSTFQTTISTSDEARKSISELEKQPSTSPASTGGMHPTPLSSLVASLALSGSKQVFAGPIEVIAKKQLTKQALPRRNFSSLSGLHQTGRHYYSGSGLRVARGAFLNRWAVQNMLLHELNKNHKATFDNVFGSWSHVFMASTASILLSPLLTAGEMPLQGFVVKRQSLGPDDQSTKLKFKNLFPKTNALVGKIPNPSLKECVREVHLDGRMLFRGYMITAFARDIPSCFALFFGAAGTNKLLDNEEKTSISKNIFAKFVGANSCYLVGGASEIYRTPMIVNNRSFSELRPEIFFWRTYLKTLPARQAMSLKVCLSYLIAEKIIDTSTMLLGEADDFDEENSAFSLMR